MNEYGTIAIFGGTGFIGTHLCLHFLKTQPSTRVILVDVNPPRDAPYTTLLQEGLRDGRVMFVKHDVRTAIPTAFLPSPPALIFNLAAIHREPGHQPHEYFETNLLGAENVCEYASRVGCERMVFTSSISPYGPTEDTKDESSLPVPETPYGSSKLAAEKIHQGWQSARPGRTLLILRPGVVFGPGEGGNVTRLVRSVVRGYFVYMSNKETRKAGGYVKELCRVVDFALERQLELPESFTLVNFSMDPPATLEQFVQVIAEVAGVRRSPLNVPRWVLMGVSHPIDFLARLAGVRQPINPVRMRKLFRSTSIDPAGLRQRGYQPYYSMKEAFADWKVDLPSDFQP